MTSQRILVVDDEAPMRKLLNGNLRTSGYQVLTAADGSEALKLIEEHTLDLVLLDLNVPGPNGFQVLEWRRANLPSAAIRASVGPSAESRDARGWSETGSFSFSHALPSPLVSQGVSGW